MLPQPTLYTERLLLRPLSPADAPVVQQLVSAREVAATTSNIPYPYPEGMAEQWIAGHLTALEQDQRATYAMTLAASGELLGSIALHTEMQHARAELGYWVGVPYWGKGYCTEAAAEMLRYGFAVLGLHRILARHFKRNPASGRVMQKNGMVYEGCMREHFLKWGQYEDIVVYGLLKEEWEALREQNRGAA